MTGFACLTLLSTLPTVAMAANSCEVLKQTSKGDSQDQPPPSTCAHAERRALNFQVIWLSQPDTLGERNWKLSIDQFSIQPIYNIDSDVNPTASSVSPFPRIQPLKMWLHLATLDCSKMDPFTVTIHIHLLPDPVWKCRGLRCIKIPILDRNAIAI